MDDQALAVVSLVGTVLLVVTPEVVDERGGLGIVRHGGGSRRRRHEDGHGSTACRVVASLA